MQKNELKGIWNGLASIYTDKLELIDILWLEIESSHTASKRHYHNLMHLEYMLDRAIKCKDHLIEPDTVMFSIFYHDIVYNIHRQDNEQKSAEFAADRLGRLEVPHGKVVKCQRQIIATKDHKSENDIDTNYLIDFDLAILGDSPEKYRAYTKKIRSEYSIYPDFLYKKGRKKVLRHFLEKDRIFKTAEFFQKYEQQARENLQAELEEL